MKQALSKEVVRQLPATHALASRACVAGLCFIFESAYTSISCLQHPVSLCLNLSRQLGVQSQQSLHASIRHSTMSELTI